MHSIEDLQLTRVNVVLILCHKSFQWLAMTTTTCTTTATLNRFGHNKFNELAVIKTLLLKYYRSALRKWRIRFLVERFSWRFANFEGIICEWWPTVDAQSECISFIHCLLGKGSESLRVTGLRCMTIDFAANQPVRLWETSRLLKTSTFQRATIGRPDGIIITLIYIEERYIIFGRG